MKCYGNFIINLSYKIVGALKYMLHIMCIPLGFHKMYLLCPCPQFLLYKVQSPSELCDPDNKTKYINSVSSIIGLKAVIIDIQGTPLFKWQCADFCSEWELNLPWNQEGCFLVWDL